jgi:succinate dehydrogenase / fumarate reductase, cytochrome b subunit
MSSVKTTLTGYVGYRGREGHWAFLLHRITGLGVLLFLGIHILDTSLVYFAPQLYADAIAIYRSTLFGIGEIALMFCLLFHGVNGLRIAYLDMFAPKDWTIEKTRRSTYWALGAALVLWVPTAGVMFYNILKFNYGLFGG